MIKTEQEIVTARFEDFDNVDNYFRHIKTFSEQIEATKMTMTSKKRVLLVLSDGLSGSGVVQLQQNMKDIKLSR